MVDILMPQLGETVTEGTITRWMKSPGDPVAEDEVLFEVSTDKVDSEVPSPVGGVVSQILVGEGETVEVGTRLAVVSEDWAAASGGSASGESTAGGAASAETAAPAETAPPAEAPAPAPAPAPGAVALAGVAPSSDCASGLDVAPGLDGVNGADGADGSGGADGAANQSTIVLSPVVRRLIAEHALDPGRIEGTGAGGRITRGDVLSEIDRRAAGGATAGGGAGGRGAAATARSVDGAKAARPGPEAAAAPVPAPGRGDTVVPFTNIRRRTAEHMVRSKHTSAHTMVAMEVDYSAVEVVRGAERERFKAAEGFSLTYLPFIARAVVDAVAEFPHVNSSVGEDELIVHGQVNLGIAVDIGGEGLLVPVVHGADGKRMRQLARDTADLAARARTKKLTMDDITGGTFTITNAGPFGT
ncbi:MAG: dihydrolipoamide acetyltransferase family protein, partial [Acidimicrobiales bacterium]